MQGSASIGPGDREEQLVCWLYQERLSTGNMQFVGKLKDKNHFRGLKKRGNSTLLAEGDWQRMDCRGEGGMERGTEKDHIVGSQNRFVE